MVYFHTKEIKKQAFMINSSEKEYILHNTGIWGLYQFLSTYLQYGYKFEIKAQSQIELSSFFSQHIGFGSVRDKKLGKNLFILFSEQCFNFLQMISWDKVLIDEPNNRIYLVSKYLSGDKEKWPDIAPFAISFYYENADKITDLKTAKVIDIKSYWFEEDELIVNHKKALKLNLEIKDDNTPIFSNKSLNVENYFELMTKQINQNIEHYNNFIPDFKGDFVEGEAHTMLKKNGVYDDPKSK